jgi:hypothetical protein
LSYRPGGLLSQSFGVYFRNLIPFLMLGVLTTAPWVALQIYAESADPRSQTPLGIVSRLVLVLMSQLLTGALCFGVVQQLRGEPAGIGDILSLIDRLERPASGRRRSASRSPATCWRPRTTRPPTIRCGTA